MAVRIYALAKELKLDSKELVDICTKAGVPGKGSALASLTDEEVEKVRQFLKGGGAEGQAGQSRRRLPPQRPSEPARAGKMPVIVTRQAAARPVARPKPAEPADEPDASDEARSRPTSTQRPHGNRDRRRRRHRASPGPLAGAMGRDEYIGPGSVRAKCRSSAAKASQPIASEATAHGRDRARAPGRQARADAQTPPADRAARRPTSRRRKSPT